MEQAFSSQVYLPPLKTCRVHAERSSLRQLTQGNCSKDSVCDTVAGTWDDAHVRSSWNKDYYFSSSNNSATLSPITPSLICHLKMPQIKQAIYPHGEVHEVLSCDFLSFSFPLELPYGWERIEDPQYGTYYVEWVNVSCLSGRGDQKVKMMALEEVTQCVVVEWYGLDSVSSFELEHTLSTIKAKAQMNYMQMM